MTELEPSSDVLMAAFQAAISLAHHYRIHESGPSSRDARDVPEILVPPEHPVDLEVVLTMIMDAANPGTVPPLSSTSKARFAHMDTGALPMGAVGAFLAGLMGRFTGVHSEAPGLVDREAGLLRWMCREFGLLRGAHSGGVAFTNASQGILHAVVAARDSRLTSAACGEGVAYVTACTHHSVRQALHAAGIPDASVRTVATTADLKMDVAVLRAQVEADCAAGKEPFLVVATAGTTDTGTIDPLAEIADVAEEHGLWLHVDGAYGGAFQFVPRGRARLAGIDRADSVGWDPSKAWSYPHGSSVLLMPDLRPLRRAFGGPTGAYMPTLPGDLAAPDFASLTLETTRPDRGTVLQVPLWVHGMATFRTHLNLKLDQARQAAEALSADPALEVPWTPDLSVIAFGVRHGDPRRLVRQLAQEDITLSATTIAGRPMAHMAIVSHLTDDEAVTRTIEAIHRLARQL